MCVCGGGGGTQWYEGTRGEQGRNTLDYRWNDVEGANVRIGVGGVEVNGWDSNSKNYKCINFTL